MKRKEFIKKSTLGISAMIAYYTSMCRVLSEAELQINVQKPNRTIDKIIPGQPVNVSPTLKVQRTLPFGGQVIDPFLLLDHMPPAHVLPKDRVGVPPHPHRGFEPVTILLEGNVEHKDSRGNHGELVSGDVQWMTAGSGIVHSEDLGNRFGEDGGLYHGVQLWVNLPKKHKMTTPDYQDIPSSTIPVIEKGNSKIRVIAGKMMDKKGPARTFTELVVLHVMMQADETLEIPFPVSHNACVQVLEGAIYTNTGKKTEGSSLVLYRKDGQHISVKAASGHTSLLVLSGEPINEPIYQYGPFVMTTKEEIIEAYDDYQAGKMGVIK